MESGLQVEQLPGRYVLTAGNLRLELARQNDRWQQHVCVRLDAAAAWSEILRSVEGTSNDPAPPSPALQDCFLQEIDSDTHELQLLGQAGQNVYSVAIRFRGLGHEISFDFCLRTPFTTGIPAVLATYEIPQLAPGGLRPEGLGSFCRIPVDASWTLELELGGDESGSRGMAPILVDEINHVVRISGASAVEVPVKAARRSLRWQYRLRLRASA